MNRLCFCLLFCIPVLASAQQTDSLEKRKEWKALYEQHLSEELEMQQQDAEEVSEMDAGEFIEALDELSRHPLNIHAVDDERLSVLLRFSEYQLYQLRRYIDLHGIIQTPQELAGIDGFTVAFVQSVMPYLRFGQPEEKDKMSWNQLAHGKSEMLCRYGRAFNARDNAADEGSSDAFLLKYTYRCTDIFRAGVVLEKDAGESVFRASNPQGFDYLSGYIFYKGKRWLKQLLLGDYQLQFGQGLAMGMGFQVSDVSPEGVKKSAYGLKAHTSANESQFLRGLAATFAVGGHWRATMFLSTGSVDASIENGVCRSLSVSGYHRTLSEIQKKHTLKRQMAGTYVDYHGKTLHWGCGAYALRYGLPLEPEKKPYSLFRFSGQELWNVAADFSWNYRKTVLFGEAAVDPGGNVACVGGVLHPAGNRLQFSMQFHLYPSGQHALPAVMNGSGDQANEQGMQCKMRLLLWKSGILDVSWKECVCPWLKYQLDFPSQNTVCQLRCTATPTRDSKWLISYRWKYSQQQLVNGNLHVPADEYKHAARACWTWMPFACWQFRMQWDGVVYCFGGHTEYGSMLSQSCSYQQRKVQLCASLAFFYTDSYRTAVYASEKDVLYVLTSPSFSGKGCRTNLVLAWKLSDSHALQLKLGMTQSLGPVPEVKSEVKFQWIWKE